MDINFIRQKKIKKVQILMQKHNFFQSTIPEYEHNMNDEKEEKALRLFMHYPMQLLRTASVHEQFFSNSTSALTGMKFTLRNMEVW